MIKVAIVDDKKLNRSSLLEKLNSSGEFEVIITAENGEDFLIKLKELKGEKPKVVLMDIDMPLLNGIDAVRYGKQIYPEIEFIMLTVFDEDDKIFDAISAGANGYLLKDDSVLNIINAIKQIIEFGAVPMSPAIARKAMRMMVNKTNLNTSTNAPHSLSERELDVLKGMVEGLDYKQIAEKHFLSPLTVRKHIANVYEKLHVTSKVDAIKLAIKNKWV